MRAKEFKSTERLKTYRKRSSIFRSLYAVLAFFLRFSILGLFLVLLASHENANPKIGKSTVEFYSLEFRKSIKKSYSFQEIDDQKVSISNVLVGQFYTSRQYMPAWTHNFEVTNNYLTLKAIISRANNFGLQPSIYELSKMSYLEALMTNTGEDQTRFDARIDLEKTTTRSAILLMLHLSKGLVTSDTFASVRKFKTEAVEKLNTMLVSTSFEQQMLAMQPHSKQYKQLQNALSAYLRKVTIDERRYMVKDFEEHRDLIGYLLVKQGLLVTGHVGDSIAEAIALKEFQRINSIKADGIPDIKTMVLLGKSTLEKFYTIALNLDRLRKSTQTDSNYVLVNIPEFKLRYVNRAGKVSLYNVIVGRKDSPTPVLNSTIRKIETNPYWTVPKSIAINELIPKIRKDSCYLAKHGFTIIDKLEKTMDPDQFDWNSYDPNNFKYKLRQTNSGGTSLGAVKFIFPNPYSIYLHDTPGKGLFSSTMRAMSHGCVRVQYPERLAQEIITADKLASNGNVNVNNLIGLKDRSEILLKEPLNIYIRYYTCTSDSLENIIFHPDIYSIDQASIRQLFENTIY